MINRRNLRILIKVFRNILTLTFFRQSFDKTTEFVLENVYPVRIIKRRSKFSVSSSARFLNPENIFIGERTNINRQCMLWAGKHSKIILGADCLLGPGVKIISSKYQVEGIDIIRNYPQFEKDIIIGNDVWLGANSIILPGVQIGNGAIIGAGTVVTKSVADFDVVVGIPALKIKSRLNV